MSPSQADRSGSTRATLIEAGVTRGALYHHFNGKPGLFRVIFEELESSITAEISAAIEAIPDQWAATIAGLGHYLDICGRPEVIRIALTDAPAVLSWQTWREIEAAHGLGLITANMKRPSEAGLLRAGPVDVIAQLMLSAVIEAALLIAHAEDPAKARDEAQQGLLLLVSGIVEPTAV